MTNPQSYSQILNTLRMENSVYSYLSVLHSWYGEQFTEQLELENQRNEFTTTVRVPHGQQLVCHIEWIIMVNLRGFDN